jgi:uncharacterized protein (DUF885 family)
VTYNINIDGADRVMTAKEKAAYEETRDAMLADAQALEAELQAKSDAKSAVLSKLGLTAEEVSALLS